MKEDVMHPLDVVRNLDRICEELRQLKPHIPTLVVSEAGLGEDDLDGMPHMVDTTIEMIRGMKMPMIYKYGKLMMEHSHIMEARPVLGDRDAESESHSEERPL